MQKANCSKDWVLMIEDENSSGALISSGSSILGKLHS